MICRYYLDTNAFGDFFEPRKGSGWTERGLTKLRAAVRAAVEQDAVVILGSLYHLEELSAPRRREERRRERMRFFFDLVRWNLLLTVPELVALEAKHRRRLQGNEPFDCFDRRQRIRRECLRGGRLDNLAQRVRLFADVSADEMKQVRDIVSARLKGTDPHLSIHEKTKRWWAEVHTNLPAWVETYLKQSSERLNLPQDEALWPAPHDVPSAWNFTAYQMARIFLCVGQQRAIRPSDRHDAFHYASACYGDIFVTEDKACLETIALVPDRPRTSRFNDFALGLGVPAQ